MAHCDNIADRSEAGVSQVWPFFNETAYGLMLTETGPGKSPDRHQWRRRPGRAVSCENLGIRLGFARSSNPVELNHFCRLKPFGLHAGLRSMLQEKVSISEHKIRVNGTLWEKKPLKYINLAFVYPKFVWIFYLRTVPCGVNKRAQQITAGLKKGLA